MIDQDILFPDYLIILVQILHVIFYIGIFTFDYHTNKKGYSYFLRIQIMRMKKGEANNSKKENVLFNQ